MPRGNIRVRHDREKFHGVGFLRIIAKKKTDTPHIFYNVESLS